MHSVKMESIVECGLEQLLSLAAEYDLMSSWNKFILDAAILHAPSMFETTVYSATWLPFPLPQADLLVTGKGFDLGRVSEAPLALMGSCITDVLMHESRAVWTGAMHLSWHQSSISTGMAHEAMLLLLKQRSGWHDHFTKLSAGTISGN